jgi:DNA helicase HerA-like ATPase
MVDVLFGARPGSEEEVDILSEAIPRAKACYHNYRAAADRSIVKKADQRMIGYSVDTPVPYRLADLIGLLDERMGKLKNRSSRMTYHRLITRIESVCNDPRYSFMFENANVGGDTMAEVLSQLFRLPPNGKPITVMQLAGFPSEVVDAVVSVICRMAFDLGLWSEGTTPLLLVCEEAHRYAAADRGIGFGPTRRSISRIAKEGRKHGVFLGLVSQRPAELDATIISQCSTLFAMRMINDRDQAILRSAVSDAAANLLDFLPSLGTGEVCAFGEGVALPARVKLKQLPGHLLPKSDASGSALRDPLTGINDEFFAAVLKRWRGGTAKQQANLDDGAGDARELESTIAAPLQPTQRPSLARACSNDRWPTDWIFPGPFKLPPNPFACRRPDRSSRHPARLPPTGPAEGMTSLTGLTPEIVRPQIDGSRV